MTEVTNRTGPAWQKSQNSTSAAEVTYRMVPVWAEVSNRIGPVW